jgi:hypothetical protein
VAISKTKTVNPDVDYVFISMDKAGDRWKNALEITIWLTIKWKVYLHKP